MWHFNSVHINFSLNPFPASMASVMDPIWFTWPHVNLKYNWTSNCQSHYFNEWKLSTFCVIFPCLQQERIASSDFQGLHSSEELFRTCHLCLFYRWIFIHVFHTLSKRTFLQLWYEIHCVPHAQVTFHSVISIHFSCFFPQNNAVIAGPQRITKAFLTRVGLVTSKSSPTIWTFWPTWNDGQNKLVSYSLVRQCLLMSWWHYN